MNFVSRVMAALWMCVLLAGCRAPDRVATAEAVRPVVVQGAMEVEVRKLAAAIEGATEEKIRGWTFWHGTIDGYPVVISKTLKGMTNAAAATAIAAERFHPVAIFNQGTAGGHTPDLHVYDIVLGTDAVNLGSFKSGYRAHGQGISAADWAPLDLMRSDGSAGNDPSARNMRRFHGDASMLAAARSVSGAYQRGQVVDGVIGSSEVWNSEIDRIEDFHSRFGTTVEEMETASAAQIAGLFEIPFAGIRVVSNNITNQGPYDPRTAEACQDYVYQVVKRYIAETLKR